MFYKVVVMKNAGFAAALVVLFFVGYGDVARAQTLMYCDEMCWPKGGFWLTNMEPQVLSCTRYYATDDERKKWQDLKNKGELANGKLLSMTSTDVPTPRSCVTTGVDKNIWVREVKVTGFAIRAKICAASVDPLVVLISVCGVTNDGKNANFFPSADQGPSPP
jgi:hypothetical protein